jgi:predicted metal-binding membrane protein
MTDYSPLERVLRRDRLVVLAGLGGVIALSWAYILMGAGMEMDAGMVGAAMTGVAAKSWSAGYVTLMFVMWAVMMVAMMLPSAAPMILLFATVGRKQRARGGAFVRTGIFALGYLAVWAAFSAVATALQWGLESLALLSPMMATSSAVLGGVILVAAGAYQLTPLKHACLRHCRTPFHFVMHGWRKGSLGALRMGVEHGAFCLGCCWVLMALLFVGGVMNLLWIAAIAAFVLLEKTVPAGHWLGGLAGVGLVVWGGITLVAALG